MFSTDTQPQWIVCPYRNENKRKLQIQFHCLGMIFICNTALLETIKKNSGVIIYSAAINVFAFFQRKTGCLAAWVSSNLRLGVKRGAPLK